MCILRNLVEHKQEVTRIVSNKLEMCTFQTAVIEFFLLVIFVQISVGHTVYDTVRKRYKADKGIWNMEVSKTASYSRVLEKSRCKVFPEGPIIEAEYYTAESNGVQIDGEDIILDIPGGGERELLWTLAVHLKASGVCYQSHARSNYMQNLKSMHQCLLTSEISLLLCTLLYNYSSL